MKANRKEPTKQSEEDGRELIGSFILECDYCEKVFEDPTEIALHVRDIHDTSHSTPTSEEKSS